MNKAIKNKIECLLTKIGKTCCCAICGMVPACLHHILPKSTHPHLIAQPLNLLPLGNTHHTLSDILAPHSSNWRARIAFDNWLTENRPEQAAWIDEMRNAVPSHVDWEAEYQNLKDNQHNIH